MDSNQKHDLLCRVIPPLLEERGQHASLSQLASLSNDRLWTTFRALVNERPPQPTSIDFLRDQDALLQGLAAEKGIASLNDTQASPLDPRLRLWRGDITTLDVDTIVNAANSQMLGCWVAGHHCIDNAIHTFAGVQLREECARIMKAQGHEEPTGQAKITRGYNLPAKHVIHTVGPIANGHPTDQHRHDLASCYTSCLNVAAENSCESIAFCCISTGIFGFPQDEAASIAVATVRTWLNQHPTSNITIVFNVFGSKDEMLYRSLLDL